MHILKAPMNAWGSMGESAKCWTSCAGALLLFVAASLAAYSGHLWAEDLDGGLDRYTGPEFKAARMAHRLVVGPCSGEPAVHRWAWQVTDIEILPDQLVDRHGYEGPAFRAKVRSHNFIGIPTGTVGAGWTAERGRWPTSGNECLAPDW
jgi:hypothetical protein